MAPCEFRGNIKINGKVIDDCANYQLCTCGKHLWSKRASKIMRHDGMKDIWLITNNDGLRYHALITRRNPWTITILITVLVLGCFVYFNSSRNV